MMKYDGEIFSIEFDGDTGCGRDIRRVRTNNCHDMRIIADMSSLEIYLGGGRYVMSTRFYPEGSTAELMPDGIDIELYPLRGMEMNINGK